jgi:hypothetical protein
LRVSSSYDTNTAAALEQSTLAKRWASMMRVPDSADPTIERSSGLLARGGKRVRRLVLPLDGDAKFSVRASRPVELALLNGRHKLATARGRRPRVTYSVCGQRRITLRLTALAGGAEAPHTLNSFLLDSHPTNGRSWEVSVGNGGDTPEHLTAWAVCAKSRA